MLGLAYTFRIILPYILLRGFTGRAICGMNVELTGAHILLSFPHYYPDTGTGSEYLNRTFVGAFGQPLFKPTSQRLTPLHNLSPASESHLPLILSYVPPHGPLRPSPEKYADIR
jgi:hypothetical protein